MLEQCVCVYVYIYIYPTGSMLGLRLRVLFIDFKAQCN